MRYSIETRDLWVNLGKNMGKHATKVVKNIINKYSQKLLDSAKKSTADAIKTASKRAIQKRAEPTGDLVGYKRFKKNNLEEAKNEIEIPKERSTNASNQPSKFKAKNWIEIGD